MGLHFGCPRHRRFFQTVIGLRVSEGRARERKKDEGKRMKKGSRARVFDNLAEEEVTG